MTHKKRPRLGGVTTSQLNEKMAFHIRVANLPPPEREFRFAAPARQWRADFIWHDARLIAEVDGGTWSGGAHVRGKRYESDCEKQNTAVLMGYRYFRFTTDMVNDGRAVATLERAFSGGKV